MKSIVRNNLATSIYVVIICTYNQCMSPLRLESLIPICHEVYSVQSVYVTTPAWEFDPYLSRGVLCTISVCHHSGLRVWSLSVTRCTLYNQCMSPLRLESLIPICHEVYSVQSVYVTTPAWEFDPYLSRGVRCTISVCHHSGLRVWSLSVTRCTMYNQCMSPLRLESLIPICHEVYSVQSVYVTTPAWEFDPYLSRGVLCTISVCHHSGLRVWSLSVTRCTLYNQCMSPLRLESLIPICHEVYSVQSVYVTTPAWEFDPYLSRGVRCTISVCHHSGLRVWSLSVTRCTLYNQCMSPLRLESLIPICHEVYSVQSVYVTTPAWEFDPYLSRGVLCTISVCHHSGLRVWSLSVTRCTMYNQCMSPLRLESLIPICHEVYSVQSVYVTTPAWEFDPYLSRGVLCTISVCHHSGLRVWSLSVTRCTMYNQCMSPLRLESLIPICHEVYSVQSVYVTTPAWEFDPYLSRGVLCTISVCHHSGLRVWSLSVTRCTLYNQCMSPLRLESLIPICHEVYSVQSVYVTTPAWEFDPYLSRGVRCTISVCHHSGLRVWSLSVTRCTLYNQCMSPLRLESLIPICHEVYSVQSVYVTTPAWEFDPYLSRGVLCTISVCHHSGLRVWSISVTRCTLYNQCMSPLRLESLIPICHEVYDVQSVYVTTPAWEFDPYLSRGVLCTISVCHHSGLRVWSLSVTRCTMYNQCMSPLRLESLIPICHEVYDVQSVYVTTPAWEFDPYLSRGVLCTISVCHHSGLRVWSLSVTRCTLYNQCMSPLRLESLIPICHEVYSVQSVYVTTPAWEFDPYLSRGVLCTISVCHHSGLRVWSLSVTRCTLYNQCMSPLRLESLIPICHEVYSVQSVYVTTPAWEFDPYLSRGVLCTISVCHHSGLRVWSLSVTRCTLYNQCMSPLRLESLIPICHEVYSVQSVYVTTPAWEFDPYLSRGVRCTISVCHHSGLRVWSLSVTRCTMYNQCMSPLRLESLIPICHEVYDVQSVYVTTPAWEFDPYLSRGVLCTISVCHHSGLRVWSLSVTRCTMYNQCMSPLRLESLIPICHEVYSVQSVYVTTPAWEFDPYLSRGVLCTISVCHHSGLRVWSLSVTRCTLYNQCMSPLRLESLIHICHEVYSVQSVYVTTPAWEFDPYLSRGVRCTISVCHHSGLRVWSLSVTRCTLYNQCMSPLRLESLIPICHEVYDVQSVYVTTPAWEFDPYLSRGVRCTISVCHHSGLRVWSLSVTRCTMYNQCMSPLRLESFIPICHEVYSVQSVYVTTPAWEFDPYLSRGVRCTISVCHHSGLRVSSLSVTRCTMYNQCMSPLRLESLIPICHEVYSVQSVYVTTPAWEFDPYLSRGVLCTISVCHHSGLRVWSLSVTRCTLYNQCMSPLRLESLIPICHEVYSVQSVYVTTPAWEFDPYLSRGVRCTISVCHHSGLRVWSLSVTRCTMYNQCMSPLRLESLIPICHEVYSVQSVSITTTVYEFDSCQSWGVLDAISSKHHYCASLIPVCRKVYSI